MTNSTDIVNTSQCPSEDPKTNRTLLKSTNDTRLATAPTNGTSVTSTITSANNNNYNQSHLDTFLSSQYYEYPINGYNNNHNNNNNNRKQDNYNNSERKMYREMGSFYNPSHLQTYSNYVTPYSYNNMADPHTYSDSLAIEQSQPVPMLHQPESIQQQTIDPPIYSTPNAEYSNILPSNAPNELIPIEREDAPRPIENHRNWQQSVTLSMFCANR